MTSEVFLSVSMVVFCLHSRSNDDTTVAAVVYVNHGMVYMQ
jgi:hypothetical protein